MASTLSTGTILRDFSQAPHGSFTFAPKYTGFVIPREEWPGMIARKEQARANLSDIWQDNKIKLLYQNGVGWCWGFGCTHGVLLQRAVENQPHVPLSPSSLCGPTVNYRDTGMPIYAALKRVVEYGIAPLADYIDPSSKIPELTQRRLWTPAVAKKALQYRCLEWTDIETYDGQPKNSQQKRTIFDMVVTHLLLNIPVVVALGWWSHCVLYCDVQHRNGKFYILGPNSHGPSYSFGGAKYPGWFCFEEGTQQYGATPYEAYGMRSITAAAMATMAASVASAI